MCNLKKKNNLRQDGAALVVTLLILSITMVSATALGRIILNEVRITINANNSLVAFYAADSAIEKALYYIKYSQARSSSGFLGNLKSKTFTIPNSTATFYYQNIATSTPGFTFYNITTSTPAHADIIDPVGNLPAIIDWHATSTDSHYYQIQWKITNCFPEHASDRLAINAHYFDSSNPFDVDVLTDLVVCNCSFDSNDFCDASLTNKTIFDNRFYRFSFRPIDSTIESLAFKIYGRPLTGSDYLVNTISNVLVAADGNYKNIKYRLNVEIPALAPVADIFSYVVFSEELLRKN